MTTPLGSGRPDQSVGNDFRIADAFMTLATEMRAVKTSVDQMRTDVLISLDATRRYSRGVDGDGAAQMIQQIRTGNNPTAGMTTPQNMERGSSSPAAAAAAAAAAMSSLGAAPSQGGGTLSGVQGAALGALIQGGGPAPSQGGGGGSYGNTPPPPTGGGYGGGGGLNPIGARAGFASPAGGGGSPLPGGMVGRLLHSIPGVGLVEDLWKFGQDQKRKGDVYRQVQGGSYSDAFQTRASEEKYARSHPAWGDGEGRQAFKDVTALGLTGKDLQDGRNSNANRWLNPFSWGGENDPRHMGDNDELRNGPYTRKSALDFMYQNKKDFSMSEGDSAALMKVAIKDTSGSLAELHKALTDVSKSAQDAGVNTQQAQLNFTGLYETFLGAGMQGGAAKMARAQSSTIASYGRGMQDVSFEQQVSTDYTARYASRAGMTMGQFENLRENNPGAAGKVMDQVNAQNIEQIIGKDALDFIKAEIEASGGSENVRSSPAQVARIAKAYRDRFQPTLEILVQQVQGLTGTTVNMNNVTQVIVEYVCGNTPGKKAAKDAAQSQMTDSKGKILGGEFKGQGAHTGKDGLAKGGVDSLTHYKVDRSGLPDSHPDSKAGKRYQEWSQRHGGKREPVIEALLQNVKGDPNKVQVKVQTGGGERIMSLAEAIRDFHNEVVAGKIEFVSGENKGKSFEEVAGIAGDSTRNWDEEGKKKTKVGSSTKDWYKKHPGDDPSKTGAGGKSAAAGTIGLTPEASRWFKVMDPGDTAGNTPPETVPR